MFTDRRGRLSRHRRRHRLAHPYGERARCARLGRRRHRGGSRDVRPADLDARPPSLGCAFPESSQTAPPRPTSSSPSPNCCGDTASSASSSSATDPASPRCRSRTARRSATCPRSTARRSRSSRSTPRHCATSGSQVVPRKRCALVEAYAKEQGLWHDESVEPIFSERVELDLSTMVPSLAGPSRPQDRVPLRPLQSRCSPRRSPRSLPDRLDSRRPRRVEATHRRRSTRRRDRVQPRPRRCRDRGDHELHEHLEPQVMIAAGLLAKTAVERGISSKPWVKTSLAPGSARVMDYYERAGLVPYLEKLGFGLVGFGCTTCIGNSGPCCRRSPAAISDDGLACRRRALGQPQLRRPDPPRRPDELPCLAAPCRRLRARRHDGHRPLLRAVGVDRRRPATCFLRDIWPSTHEVAEVMTSRRCRHGSARVRRSPRRRRRLAVPRGPGRRALRLGRHSTYVRRPPFFEGMQREPEPLPTSSARGSSRCSVTA